MKRLVAGAATLAAMGIGVHARADATDEGARARAEATSAVAALDATTAHVRDLVRRARPYGRGTELSCLDGALSRADTAARYGRDLAKRAVAAYAVGDVMTGRHEMTRLAWRREAAHDAWTIADACAPSAVAVVPSRGTVVSVWIDPSLPRDAAAYP
jgi:hypothetical protein